MSTKIKIVSLISLLLVPAIVKMFYPETIVLGHLIALIWHFLNLFVMKRYLKFWGIAFWECVCVIGSPIFVGEPVYADTTYIDWAIRAGMLFGLVWLSVVFIPSLMAKSAGEEIKSKPGLGTALKKRGARGGRFGGGEPVYRPRPMKNNYAGPLREGSWERMPSNAKPGRDVVKQVGGLTVHGVPGSSIGGNADKFGNKAEIGAQGERIVGGKLERAFSNVPGSALYNGVKFNPNGIGQSDVDHALVLGNNLYLIDAKNYRAGNYKELPGGRLEVTDTNGNVSYRDIKMSDAHALWKKHVPFGTRVAPKSYVALEGGQKNIMRIKNSNMYVGTTEEVINEIKRDHQANGRPGSNDYLKSFVQSKML